MRLETQLLMIGKKKKNCGVTCCHPCISLQVIHHLSYKQSASLFIKNNNSMPEESQRRPCHVLVGIIIAMKIGTTKYVFAEGQVHLKSNKNY